MDLYIYNRNLELQGIIDVYSSLRWRRKYFTCGEFELHCSPTIKNISLLMPESIIARRDSVEAGVIEYINITDTDLTIKGRFLSSYLDRRIVWNTTRISDTTENAIRKLVVENAINPTDTNRCIYGIHLGGINNYIEITDIQVSYKNLLSTLEKLSKTSNIAFRIRPDFQVMQLYFETYKGSDKSINQSTNPHIVFSKEFENLQENTYELACTNFKNITLVGGAGEGAERRFVTVGSGSGLDRYEVFTDARDIQDTVPPMDESQYLKLLTEKGQQTLSSSTVIENFEAKVNLQGNVKYKQDFDLGDVVTVINTTWGKFVNVRITEIEEVYENGVVSITPTFGSPAPEILDLLKGD